MNYIHKQGDTFEAVNFQLFRNTQPIDLTGAIIKMQIRKECGSIPIISFTSVANAGITITAPLSGMFKINKQIINIAEYNYLYDIEITFSDGTVKTWIEGEFLINCDITR